MTIQKISAILKRCEQDLQAVLQEVVQRGDYNLLLQVTRWTQAVADLADEVKGVASEGGRPGDGAFHANTKSAVDGYGRSAVRKTQVPRSVEKRSVKRLNKNEYPKFARYGDNLIKTGWSKKDKKEYRHKAPKRVAELLRDALISAKGESRILSTDELFPMREKDGGEIPGYQPYVCLAWLRSEGLVVQEGRRGYRVPSTKKLLDSFSTRWHSLPEV